MKRKLETIGTIVVVAVVITIGIVIKIEFSH